MLRVCGTQQVGALTSLESRVTAPERAIRRPSNTEPVVAVMDASAMTDPANTENVPNVADDPTCQYTLHERAPFTNATMLEDAVVKLLAVLKTNTAFGSPPPSSVSVPVISAVPVSYAPGPI